jgi:hypothetical protein
MGKLQICETAGSLCYASLPRGVHAQICDRGFARQIVLQRDGLGRASCIGATLPIGSSHGLPLAYSRSAKQGISPETRAFCLDFRVYVWRSADCRTGNLLFVLCHEMAHAAMTQMRLPVLGKAEDAADSFATLRMIKVGSAFSRSVLLDASTGWFLSARRDEEIGEKMVYYDEHGLDRQRDYQIVCLMVGSDKEQFKSLAEETGLPPGRQNSCVDDYASASYSWDLVLGPHLRSAYQPKTVIDEVYGPAENGLEGAAQAARSIRLLETVAESVAEAFVWPAPFTIEMQSCGFPNAYWALTEHKLTVCYELAIEFAELYRNYSPAPTEAKVDFSSINRR